MTFIAVGALRVKKNIGACDGRFNKVQPDVPGVFVMVGGLFLAVPWGCLRFVIVVFPDHTHLLFLNAFYLCCCYQACVK